MSNKKDPNAVIVPTNEERTRQFIAQLYLWLHQLLDEIGSAHRPMKGIAVHANDVYCAKDFTHPLLKLLERCDEQGYWDAMTRQFAVTRDYDDDADELPLEETSGDIESKMLLQEKRIKFAKLLLWREQERYNWMGIELERLLVKERSMPKKADVVAKLTKDELAVLGLDAKGNLKKGK